VIVLLCGRSFSGKSTVAEVLARQLPATAVSLDAINAERGLHGGQGIPIEEWSRTNGVARDRTRSCIAAGVTVVVDDTSSPRFLRDGWRALADEQGVSLVLVHIDTPIEVSLQWHRTNRDNPLRDDVDDAVMRAHLESFEPPGGDEKVIRLGPGASDVTDLVAALRLRVGTSDA